MAPPSMRTLLLIPAGNALQSTEASSADADALVLEFESAQPQEAKAKARDNLVAFLKARDRQRPVFVRLSGLDDEESDADLRAAMAGAPFGIVLQRAASGRDVARLGARIAACEAEYDLVDGSTKIIAVAPAHPAAMFAMDTFIDASPRLFALSWSEGDIAKAIGAKTCRDAEGKYLGPFDQARAACLFAAAAAGVPAFDTLSPGYDFARDARDAHALGFAGKFIADAGQIATVNAAMG